MKTKIFLCSALVIIFLVYISTGCMDDNVRNVTFTVYTKEKTTETPIQGVGISISNIEIATDEEFAGQADANGYLQVTRKVDCGAEINIAAVSSGYKLGWSDDTVDCNHPTYTFYLEPKP